MTDCFRKSTFFHILYVLLVASLFNACSPVKTIKFDASGPPEISLPSPSSRIGIINMVASEPSSKVYIETEILYLGAARDGSNAICSDFARVLKKNTNYIVLDVEYKGTDDNKMEESLMSKAEAEKYFMNLNVDALFVVGYFYTNIETSARELYDISTVDEPVFISEII